MSGFGGATGVPQKQMQDAIAQSTANSTSEAFTITLSGVSANHTVFKTGKICRLHFSLGNSTAFSSATGADAIGTIPIGYRPNYNICSGIVLGRTVDVWANANYYPFVFQIDTGGNITLRGNATNLKQCKYLIGELYWTTNNP